MTYQWEFCHKVFFIQRYEIKALLGFGDCFAFIWYYNEKYLVANFTLIKTCFSNPILDINRYFRHKIGFAAYCVIAKIRGCYWVCGRVGFARSLISWCKDLFRNGRITKFLALFQKWPLCEQLKTQLLVVSKKVWPL